MAFCSGSWEFSAPRPEQEGHRCPCRMSRRCWSCSARSRILVTRAGSDTGWRGCWRQRLWPPWRGPAITGNWGRWPLTCRYACCGGWAPASIHRGIENLEHRHRDTAWREDDCQAWRGNGPRAMATQRNLALGLLHLAGVTKVKQAVQAIGRNPLRAIPLIT
jgi:hypothetical protein